MEELAKDLENLPIETGKVHLWLVYRKTKPMATIVMTFNWEEDEAKRKQVIFWLKRAGVKFEQSQRFENALHVSLEKKILNKHREIELDESEKAHFIRGSYYGFPNEAALAYSEIVQREKMFPNEKIIHAPMVEELKTKYWYPYIEYLLRIDHELEDSMFAKRWADLAREEIPLIADEYEKEQMEALKKLKEELKQVYK